LIRTSVRSKEDNIISMLRINKMTHKEDY
jgi:hypothetical protein